MNEVNERTAKYAELLVKTGLNVQKGQILVITTPIECAAFARQVAEAAFAIGAKDVAVNWRDENMAKVRYLHAPNEVFDDYPEWQKEFYVAYARKGAAFLRIDSSDPELLADVDAERLIRTQRTANSALAEYRDRLMSNKNAWCVASMPTLAWAKKVFPHVSDDEAMSRLWDAIFATVRIDQEDPVAAWEIHKATLRARIEQLNSLQLEHLRFTNSLGTDLSIKLSPEHLWLGGSDYTEGGVEFIANMPTEEVFTLPLKSGVNGVVKSSMPLVYNGNLIDGFTLVFKDGKVMEYSADKGEEILGTLLGTDEGARHLGEVALVPVDSPISKLGMLFFNTLFDENASCHLALGKAYSVCVKGGASLPKHELDALGVNDSLVHEDFMIGTPDMSIVGTTRAGVEVQIFKDGAFVLG